MRIAGLDIGGTSVKIGLFDTEKGLVTSETMPSPLGDPQRMADALARRVKAMDVALVGVGMAGAVDQRSGLVDSGNLMWRHVPLRALLEEATGLPVWVDNDAQAAMMAECFDGALQGVREGVYLTLGTGVGGALLIDGKPWRGHTNTAAELGHVITHADGLPCGCGKRGCLEMYASARALSRMGGGADAKRVIDGARAGEPEMREAFRRYLHELGLGLATLIMVFNPEVVALGGGISAAGDVLLEGAREQVRTLFAVRPDYFEGEIRLAKHLNDAGMIGAAWLARTHAGR